MTQVYALPVGQEVQARLLGAGQKIAPSCALFPARVHINSSNQAASQTACLWPHSSSGRPCSSLRCATQRQHPQEHAPHAQIGQRTLRSTALRCRQEHTLRPARRSATPQVTLQARLVPSPALGCACSSRSPPAAWCMLHACVLA